MDGPNLAYFGTFVKIGKAYSHPTLEKKNVSRRVEGNVPQLENGTLFGGYTRRGGWGVSRLGRKSVGA